MIDIILINDYEIAIMCVLDDFVYRFETKIDIFNIDEINSGIDEIINTLCKPVKSDKRVFLNKNDLFYLYIELVVGDINYVQICQTFIMLYTTNKSYLNIKLDTEEKINVFITKLNDLKEKINEIKLKTSSLVSFNHEDSLNNSYISNQKLDKIDEDSVESMLDCERIDDENNKHNLSEMNDHDDFYTLSESEDDA